MLWAVIGLLLTLVVAAADYATGYEVAFSLFYLLPIAIFAWFLGRTAGLAVSFLAAALWLLADLMGGHPYSHPAIAYWNAVVRLGFFVTVALLLSALRAALQAERSLARTDHLTGAYNARFFRSLAQSEILRSERFKHPFVVAYVDLDNFKMINDQFGHSVGDDVLRTMVECLKSHLRRTDVVARLGGDEFVLLLPETGRDGAEVVLSKVRQALTEGMESNHWPVTFSIGAVAYVRPPKTPDELVLKADNLMYTVKAAGKNGIRYVVSE